MYVVWKAGLIDSEWTRTSTSCQHVCTLCVFKVSINFNFLADPPKSFYPIL